MPTIIFNFDNEIDFDSIAGNVLLLNSEYESVSATAWNEIDNIKQIKVKPVSNLVKASDYIILLTTKIKTRDGVYFDKEVYYEFRTKEI